LVTQLRSPLTFETDGETVEISHVTKLAMLAHKIKEQLPDG
jgi:hypothetical protein